MSLLQHHRRRVCSAVTSAVSSHSEGEDRGRDTSAGLEDSGASDHPREFRERPASPGFLRANGMLGTTGDLSRIKSEICTTNGRSVGIR